MANDRTTARPEGLTTLEERFCEEYVVDYRAGPAYERAGGQAKRPRQQGYMLLKRPDIRARVDELIAEQKERTRITADRVLIELANIAFSDPGQVMDWAEGSLRIKDSTKLTPAQRALIAEISQTETATGGSTRVKLHDRISALEKLAKHLGLYSDAPTVNVNVTYEQALAELDDEGMFGENGDADG